MSEPRLFVLRRSEDPTGVSGTGDVADGVVWPDGTVSIRWRGPRPSTVNWGSLVDAEAVHGHGGATRIVYRDDTQSEPGDGLCTATIHGAGPTPDTPPIRCTRKAGHYDEEQRPTRRKDSQGTDPGGWHKGPQTEEYGTLLWADGADGATPHGAAPGIPGQDR